MLTSLFYYEHYRPYILNTAELSENKQSRPVRKKTAVSEKDDAPTDVALNKALNKDVINYAKNIYRNTTDLKYSSKKLASDIKNYSKYKDRDEFSQDVFEKGFKDDLTRFAGSYNRSVKFLKGQSHSRYLSESADKLEDTANNFGEILMTMGVNKSESGELTPDGENMLWSGENASEKTEAAERLFSKVNEQTVEILNEPMARHMNFKSLNYYYNYAVDSVQVDSFQIIKTGLLVNIAL